MGFVSDEGVEMSNPVGELLWLLVLVHRFKEAIANNLVMDFEEYCDRFGFDFGEKPREDRCSLPCEPFVYIDGDKGGYASRRYETGDVVGDTCIVGHRDIVSVYGERSEEWGKPRLVFELCNDDDTYRGDGWMWFRLEYVPKFEELYGDDANVPMAPDVYLNRKTGEYHWGQYGC